MGISILLFNVSRFKELSVARKKKLVKPKGQDSWDWQLSPTEALTLIRGYHSRLVLFSVFCRFLLLPSSLVLDFKWFLHKYLVL